MLEGLDDLLGTLDEFEEYAEDFSKDMGAPAHAEIVRQMESSTIPTQSGDLAKSLRDPDDPQHIWVETPDGYSLASTNRAAKFNPDAVPDIDADAVTLAIVGAL